MQPTLHAEIEKRAKTYSQQGDPSHDWNHIMRVLGNALHLARHEGGDLDVIIPAVYFHDAVNYPKNDPRAAQATRESAAAADMELRQIKDYPAEKIPAVQTAIMEHSFSAGLQASTLESQIVQDADRLEATGAISIMRTFASTGQFQRPFYNLADPFCENRTPDPKENAIDLFYVRLLRVKDTMNTPSARELAERRTVFLENFLLELKDELALSWSAQPKL